MWFADVFLDFFHISIIFFELFKSNRRSSLNNFFRESSILYFDFFLFSKLKPSIKRRIKFRC